MTWNDFWKRLTGANARPARATHLRLTPTFETLDDRIVPSVTASFSTQSGVLTVFGDSADNKITVGRDAAGTLSVNGGAVRVQGGTATVANTSLIRVFGLAGNDTIKLDETNGALPRGELFGGAGDDTITGGSGNDLILGQDGNDTLFGKGGDDTLLGGNGNDVLTGGAGNDLVVGGAGDDRMIWNPGDGTDVNEGGDGNDTVEVNGGNAAENFTATANGSRVRFDRVSPAPFSLDIGTTENLVVNMNGGDDTFTGSNGLAPLIHLTVDGGDGNDTIIGGDGADTLIGGAGNDVINGGRGNDLLPGGSGDDTFVWNPGDGSDTVEGQGGNDTLQFNGANISEKFDLSANGDRLRLFRDVGNVTMDVHGVENVNIAARGGADQITVNDLTGAGVKAVNLDLGGSAGGGDGAPDQVVVNGTAGNDVVDVVGGGTGVSVLGLYAAVNITNTDPNLDQLTVNGLKGDDVIDASSVQGSPILFTANGGDGDDVLIGTAGNDTLLGGNGDDVLIGHGGHDVLDGGPGNNTILN